MPHAVESKYAQEHAAAVNATAPEKPIDALSPVLPFGIPAEVSAIGGTQYITAQELVQQVAYTVSEKLFTYSPESFGLDDAAKKWAHGNQANGSGAATAVLPMEARLGAASAILGYVFSKDRSAKDRELVESIVTSSGSLVLMQHALSQLSTLYSLSNPLVAHVSAIDYSASAERLVTDYVAPLNVAKETGAALVTSVSAHEVQHMALFATLASLVLPTLHVYDGLKVARETTKVHNVLDQAGVQRVYDSIALEQKSAGKKAGQAAQISKILKNLNGELGTSYSFFEYEGAEHPGAVLVVFGSVEAALAREIASLLSKTGEKVGVIVVRVYSPFCETAFLEALPKTVKRVVVLGQVTDEIAVSDTTVQSPLFGDVFSAISLSPEWSIPPSVIDLKYPREHIWSPRHLSSIFYEITRQVPSAVAILENSANSGFNLVSGKNVHQFTFWDIDNAPTAKVPSVLAKFLAQQKSSSEVTFNASFDNIAQAGVFQGEIRVSKNVLEAPFYVDYADVTFVGDIKLLGTYDILHGLKYRGTLLLKGKFTEEEFEKKVPLPVRKNLVRKGISVISIDTTSEEGPEYGSALVELAFLHAAKTGIVPQVAASKLAQISSPEAHKAAEKLESSLVEVLLKKEWVEVEEEGEAVALPVFPTSTAFGINTAKLEEEPKHILKSSEHAAKALAFKEAYGVETALRPDLTVRNFVVKVQENKRLTPEYYDRNIFHIDFDLTGTGMTYEIGEALGIHAQNDKALVNDFIKFYGLNPEDIVEVPSRDDPDILETRTVYQALLNNLDIFGKPPKKFYEALAEFASDEGEKKSLLTLASPEGAAEFKRLAEVDNVTFADILLDYPSAHPEFHDLAKIVSPMKRREYSIASSQKVNPNSVQLLIVVVNWRDNRGRDRWGQASRYLSLLPVGAEVVVSVKPSVMKLPPLPTQPIIMAGLGTGLAPFRAFVQYRAWQKQQGIEIGSVLLYMGSRHQREEYLYGEEWEAYQAAGVITLMGCAFSRDQARKIYIQDRMRETIDDIVKAYMTENGAFYLCGPTWPVPDVSAVLQEAISLDAQNRGVKVDSRKQLEALKDELRYVLEVY